MQYAHTHILPKKTLTTDKWAIIITVSQYLPFILPLSLIVLPLIIQRCIGLRYLTSDVRLHRPDRLHQVFTEQI